MHYHIWRLVVIVTVFFFVLLAAQVASREVRSTCQKISSEYSLRFEEI